MKNKLVVEVSDEMINCECLADEVSQLVHEAILARESRRYKTALRLFRSASQKANWLNQALAWYSKAI